MKHIYTILALIFLSILSCKVPTLLISENLKENTTVLDVNGRQGWQFNQVISFGDYVTSKIKKGWTRSTDFTFIARFKNANKKRSFAQFGPNGSAEVFCVSKFKSSELDLLDGFLSVPLDYENYFAGSILMDDNAEGEWDFIIYNPEGDITEELKCGKIEDQKGNTILINGIRKLENQSTLFAFENYGFEFLYQGEVIGAVSTLNNGKVWIKNSIDYNFQLVIASVSTSLLVRENLKDSF